MTILPNKNEANFVRELALLGATASGKTSLALKLANKLDGVILSLDSLSIYKEIDIASAKPSKEEQKSAKHFGIDVINPNEPFNVTLFFNLYNDAKKYCLDNDKTLIIVGGTSFYLKAMLSGLSDKPQINELIRNEVSKELKNLDSVYELICQIDNEYANKITNKDAYRMEKWLEIYLSTKQKPSEFLKHSMQKSVIKDIPIYELLVDKNELREKIALRTKLMIKDGLVDEIVGLEQKYSRAPRCMKAIGIKEVFEYLDGYLTLAQMEEKITTNTAKLAKRQRTFNKTQFSQEIIKDAATNLFEKIVNNFT